MSTASQVKSKWPLDNKPSPADSQEHDPPKNIEPHEAVIARLARLHPVEFDRVCKGEAEKLGCTVETLRGEIKKARGDNEELGSGRRFEIKKPELWPETVDGAELLNELATTFQRFVVLPDHGDTIVALWTLHSYTFELGDITPILVVCSPEKGCGKTTLRDVLHALVCAPLSADGISASALFRVIEKWKPTMLLDDFDSWGKDNEELRGVLNTGHRKGGVLVRCVGDDSEPHGFSTFSPKVINLIGRLHPTLHDRAILITLRRRLRGEPIVSLHGFNGEELQRKCARWAWDNARRIESAKPVMTDGLFNRQADNWRPLYALADVAGGNWPEKVNQAALAALAATNDGESSAIMLLDDIHTVFKTRNADRLSTEALLVALTGMDDRPWPDHQHGKPLNSRGLAKLLKPFGIRPDSIRLEDGRTPKGYMLEWFEDAFARYLPDDLSATPQQS